MAWAARFGLQGVMARMRDFEGGNTPLMLGCYKGNVRVVHRLLASAQSDELRMQMVLDVDVSPNKKGWTPLIYASVSPAKESAVQCAQILMRYICDEAQRLEYIEHACQRGKTALQHTRNETLQALLTGWKLECSSQQ